ncbi:Predicted membrane protein [Raineyella antarctica]|uniref:Predicted membrane protein n=1 Tax=Raineyella antarctica TaxID=1577474 RepID=A0A1G6GEY0_9ACTN|nr:DUF2339 domain-containing protein [Raineyella antarctica]SDB80537.1 Predicted membrane protein [Raineyella antarctica]
MTAEDPDTIAARIRADVSFLSGRLEALAADLRLLAESVAPRQRTVPGPPQEELPDDWGSDGNPPDVTTSDEPVEDEPVEDEPDQEPQQPEIPTRRPARSGLPKFFTVAGSAVALIGVASVLLPAGGAVPGQLTRTALGLGLAVIAVVAAVWQHRIDPANVGARALLATGLVSVYLCVLALTVRFVDDQGRPLVALLPGLVVTGLVGLAGLWAARSWRSQGIAVAAVLGGLLVAPVVETGPADGTLAVVGFMVLLTLVAGVAQLGLGWVWLLLGRTVPTVLYAIWVAASPSVFRWGPGLSLVRSIGVAVLLAAVLALGSFALALLHRSASRRERVAEAAGLTALSTPLMVVAQTQETVAPAATACLVLGVVLLAVMAWGASRRSTVEVRTTTVPLGVLFLAFGVLVALGRQFLGYLPWALAIVCLALAERSRSTAVLVAGSILGVVGLVWWLPVLPVLFHTSFVVDVADRGVERVVQSLLGLVVAALAYRAYKTFFPRQRTRALHLAWSGAVVVGAAAVVLTGSLVGSSLGDMARGFRVAHVLVTIGLALLCIVLVSPRLQAGRERRARARLAVGLAVTAVAKLFLFDTRSLPGLWRAAAFIAVGVLLLVVGTWYYRQLEGRRVTPDPGASDRAGD